MKNIAVPSAATIEDQCHVTLLIDHSCVVIVAKEAGPDIGRSVDATVHCTVRIRQSSNQHTVTLRIISDSLRIKIKALKLHDWAGDVGLSGEAALTGYRSYPSHGARGEQRNFC